MKQIQLYWWDGIKVPLNTTYDNKYQNLYIKDTEGNMYELPCTNMLNLRDIKFFIYGIENITNHRFERIHIEESE